NDVDPPDRRLTSRAISGSDGSGERDESPGRSGLASAVSALATGSHRAAAGLGAEADGIPAGGGRPCRRVHHRQAIPHSRRTDRAQRLRGDPSDPASPFAPLLRLPRGAGRDVLLVVPRGGAWRSVLDATRRKPRARCPLARDVAHIGGGVRGRGPAVWSSTGKTPGGVSRPSTWPSRRCLRAIYRRAPTSPPIYRSCTSGGLA